MGHISKFFLAVLLAFPSIAWSADRLNVYPIDTCAVAKKNELGSMGKPIIKEIEGREFRLCCKGWIMYQNVGEGIREVGDGPRG